MAEPRTVYAVTSGEYSAYRVVALFELEQDADAAMRSGLGDDVAEYRYYPAGTPLPTKVGYWVAFAHVGPDGSHLGGPHASPREEWTSDTDFVPPHRPKVWYGLWANGGKTVNAEAMTEEAAIKACSDAVAKLRAEALESEQAKSAARRQRIAAIRERRKGKGHG